MRRMFSEKQIESQIKQTKKDIATLIDSNGNSRFVEGDITMKTITGVTQTYGKWSLSATHLMLVIGFTIDNNTVLSPQAVANVDLPEYIYNKIIPLWTSGNHNYVARYTNTIYDADGQNNQNLQCFLLKDTKVGIQIGSLTANSDKIVRVAFDLLIDAD